MDLNEYGLFRQDFKPLSLQIVIQFEHNDLIITIILLNQSFYLHHALNKHLYPTPNLSIHIK
jgi:hypothetical protein